MKKIKDILIVGGGSSGCISALILKKRFPQFNIAILKSEKIENIGVGEGITEHWRAFSDFVGLDEFEVIKECGSTFKAGIVYKNWSENEFMHSIHPLATESIQGYHYALSHAISNRYPAKKLVSDLLWENKFTSDFFNHKKDIPVFQYHFDSNKLNNYLLKKCQDIGVDVLYDEIEEVNFNENEEIESVSSTKMDYNFDFYIDCTGFHRFLLLKKYKRKWISYSDYLPVNSAFAFPTDEMEEYNCYTLITAHKNGWSWTTPVQGRTGNGYVYSDKFISDDDAVLEIEKHLSKKINVFKFFKFDAGKLDKFWHKNCVAIGLAASFIEPLEASSLGTVIQQSLCLITHLTNFESDLYNEKMNKMFCGVLDFIQAHYLTKREDTEFWRSVKYDLKLTDSLKNLLSIWKNRLPNHNDFNIPWQMFSPINYIPILYGLGWFDVDKISQEYEYFAFKDDVQFRWEQFHQKGDQYLKFGHKEIIDIICKF